MSLMWVSPFVSIHSHKISSCWVTVSDVGRQFWVTITSTSCITACWDTETQLGKCSQWTGCANVVWRAWYFHRDHQHRGLLFQSCVERTHWMLCTLLQFLPTLWICCPSLKPPSCEDRELVRFASTEWLTWSTATSGIVKASPFLTQMVGGCSLAHSHSAYRSKLEQVESIYSYNAVMLLVLPR